MYVYSLGLMVGKKIQHALQIQAPSLPEAQDRWAREKKVAAAAHWDAAAKTYKGCPLICFETSDPAVTVHYKVKAKTGQPSPGTPPAQEQPEGVSINLKPPTDVPDFNFQKTWIADPNEKKKTHVGFDDDKPL